MNRAEIIAQLDDALSWYKETATWRTDVEWTIAEAKANIYPLMVAIAKGETLSWWDDAAPVKMLRAKFPESHPLWTHLTLKVTTRFGKSFESGYNTPIKVKGFVLAIPTPSGEPRPGHERFWICKDHTGPSSENRTGEVWRSAHDNVNWCYEFKWGDSGWENRKFHGTSHKKIEDVVLHIVSWLVDSTKDDPEVIDGAKRVIQVLKVGDDVPDAVLNRKGK